VSPRGLLIAFGAGIAVGVLRPSTRPRAVQRHARRALALGHWLERLLRRFEAPAGLSLGSDPGPNQI
jgi:hypothetical protein